MGKHSNKSDCCFQTSINRENQIELDLKKNKAMKKLVANCLDKY